MKKKKIQHGATNVTQLSTQYIYTGYKSCRREDKQKKEKEIATRVQIILYALPVATQCTLAQRIL